jgi:hypothetical protein
MEALFSTSVSAAREKHISGFFLELLLAGQKPGLIWTCNGKTGTPTCGKLAY